MKPLISIVVPVYNAGGFLIETVNSVIAQTYSNWELLLINDGSTDHSEQIIKEFEQKDARISGFSKVNGGQASARNYGIKKSTGSYIAFLDADDLWLPNKLVDQLRDIEEYNPDFLYGLGYYYYPEKETQLIAYNWVSGEMTGDAFFKILFHSCAVNTNTVLVKKSLFDSVGYFDEDEAIRGTEDWDLWLRIAKQVDRVYGSPARNVYYRIHDGGIHLQRARMIMGKIQIYDKYAHDSAVAGLMLKREYRYNYRELFNRLAEDGRANEIKQHLQKFGKVDPWGFGTLKQRVLFKVLSVKAFLWVSNKIVYRIAYRLERLTYFLFLKK